MTPACCAPSEEVHPITTNFISTPRGLWEWDGSKQRLREQAVSFRRNKGTVANNNTFQWQRWCHEQMTSCPLWYSSRAFGEGLRSRLTWMALQSSPESPVYFTSPFFFFLNGSLADVEQVWEGVDSKNVKAFTGGRSKHSRPAASAENYLLGIWECVVCMGSCGCVHLC